MSVTNLNDKSLRMRTLILYYTVLFAIIALGVFSVFLLLGKSFIQYGDGFRQGFFWSADFKHGLESFFAGDGLPQWSWYKGLGMPYMYRADPFNLIAALFPYKYLELGITVALLLKLYFGGMAYLFFAIKMKLANFQCLVGSICYIFSTWFVSVTMVQGSFTFVAILTPLLILSIDWVYRGRSPIFFIAIVSYFLIRDAYLAYMAAIVAIIFMFLRYFAHTDEFSIRDYFSKIGKFIIYGLTAGLISIAFSSQFVLATLNASMESRNTGSGSLLVGRSYILGFIDELMTGGLTPGYTYFGFPILALLLLPIAIRKISLRNTPALMTVLLLAMSFFPFCNSMFNGFGYGTARWFYLVIFFGSWASMECMDIENLRSKTNIRIMTIWLLVILLGTIGFDAMGLTDLSLRTKAFILLNIAAGAALIFVISAIKSPKITILYRQIACICIVGLVLMVSWSLSFYLNQNKFIPVGETAQRLDNTTQRAGAMIDDDGFYKLDQVDWLNCHQSMEMPDNENLWYQTKSIYVYDTFTTAKQFESNKYFGNNYGYMMRVYILSNDNRMGLDFLHGVKYFLGNDVKAEKKDSSKYAGYGFSYVNTLDGVDVLRNKYDPGLGFAYDKYISESEFNKLTRPEREQAVLQAVVIPDEDCLKLDGMNELTASDVETDVTNVEYEIVALDGIIVDDGKLIANKEDAGFDIKLNGIERSQVLVSFDNLSRVDKNSFHINCFDGNIIEVAHLGSSNQSLPNVVDFDMNMGYYNSFDGTMHISVNKPGEYTFDKFYVSAMSVDNYDKYAQQRMESKYQISDYSNHNVSGSVDMKANGILYFSIPQYHNWDVYVDGDKVDKLTNVNIAYMGVEVPKGQHDVVLKYNNVSLKIGIAASILGIIIATIIGILYREKRGRIN